MNNADIKDIIVALDAHIQNLQDARKSLAAALEVGLTVGLGKTISITPSEHVEFQHEEKPRKTKRKLSKEAREKISRTQKLRWARQKAKEAKTTKEKSK